MTEIPYDEARRRRQAAANVVNVISAGRTDKWRLHIPAREDDPDVVLDDALLALDAMIARAEAAEAAAQHFGNEWAQAVQLGTKLSEQWAAATKRAEQAEHSLANLTAQLAAVGTYVRYYAAANDAYMAVGRPSVLSFDEWWQTAHCPNCGNVQVDRAPGPGADSWECAGRDGCGYNWPVEPQT